MVKLLKLQHHKHTAKKLHHRHTSYRSLWLIMLIFGLFILAMQKASFAESFNVSAKVPAPIPLQPAEITHPAANAVFSTPNVIVSGSCPVINPPIIVTIYRSGEFLGSGGCSSTGYFFTTIQLLPGNNALQPIIRTITDDNGPAGQIINLIYTKAVTEQPADPLNITAVNPFIIFKANESFEWEVTIGGGQSPYLLLVDWGDGQSDKLTINESGKQKLKHTYNDNKTYLVRASLSDNLNSQVDMSLAAVSSVQSGADYFQTTTGVTGRPIYIIAFIIYWALAALIIAFWLGTKYEYLVLSRRTQKRR